MTEAERYQQDRAVWAEKKKAWAEHEQRLRDRIRELEVETTRRAQEQAELRAELEANGKLLEAAHQRARGLYEETAQLAEAFLHNVPAEGGDDLDRVGRYSNGTVQRIAAALRAKGART